MFSAIQLTLLFHFTGITRCLQQYKLKLSTQNDLSTTSVTTATAPVPAVSVVNNVTLKQSSPTFRTIDQFAWDQGEYNSPTVTVYIDLESVGSLKDTPSIQCDFTSSSFDLKVFGLNGSNYRLLKDNLDKDIEPSKSKYIVKKGEINIFTVPFI